ncbi:ParB/RepB/Spo0J family partition protein, partial [Candidatus Cloacimonadota bacterium]
MTRLGKGLEALINSGPESIDRTTGITTVKVDMIFPNRYQPRKYFDQKKLQELANSLKENGIIQPIIVTKKDDTNYELVAGERRLEAAKLAGFNDIPVIIRSISLKEQLQFSIIENVQREDLSPIEEANAYQRLNEEFNLTHAQISDIVGKDRATITNIIRLLKLPDSIQQMILNEQLSPGHARAILQVAEKDQENFANMIINNIYSVRKAEQEAKLIKEKIVS